MSLIYRSPRASYVSVKHVNTNDTNSARFYSVILKLCSTSDDILRSTTQAALLFEFALLVPLVSKVFTFHVSRVDNPCNRYTTVSGNDPVGPPFRCAGGSQSGKP